MDLTKLSKAQRVVLSIIVSGHVLVGILGVIAVLFGFYKFYYGPEQEMVAILRQNIATKEGELNASRTQASVAKKLEKNMPELERQLNILKAKIATGAEIISLIKTVEEEALRLDLKILNMVTNVQEPPQPGQKGQGAQAKAPPEEGQTSDYTKISFDISLQGEYRKLEDFLRALQNVAPYLNISELNMSSDEELYPELTSRLVINAYNKKGGGVGATDRRL
ncbi:MAG: GspMb/PilO family protein [Candidatus Brocadiales bacterium]